jgi:lysophospholipase L1-like esterase
MKRIVCLLFLTATVAISAFTHRPITWVAIGDSITYLNDHPDETKDRMSHGYLKDVVEKLPYINFAKSWDKLNIPSGDVFTVFLGTNDWWHSHRIGSWQDYEQGTGDSTIYGCFRVILDKLHGLNKDAPIILLTPMPRADFVYINNPKNNAYGSYKPKDGQTLEQVADAILDIGRRENLRVIDLYHVKSLAVPHLVKFKHVKDSASNAYHDYPYPKYTTIPFDPAQSEYAYPPDAIDMTYDGLHPSDKGCAAIAKQLVKVFRKL